MRGVDVTGRREDVVREFREVIGRARGEEGESMREEARRMSGMMKEEREGVDRKVIEAFAAS